MAEGALRSIAEDRFEAASAGTTPTRINPTAVRVMAEVRIDISEQRSKSVVEMMGEQFDFVITVCDRAQEACPVFPGNATRLHWSFDDPAIAKGSEEARLLVFRRVRDEIVSRIEQFVAGQIDSTAGAIHKAGMALAGNRIDRNGVLDDALSDDAG